MKRRREAHDNSSNRGEAKSERVSPALLSKRGHVGVPGIWLRFVLSICRLCGTAVASFPMVASLVSGGVPSPSAKVAVIASGCVSTRPVRPKQSLLQDRFRTFDHYPRC